MRTPDDLDPPPDWDGLLDADQWRRARTVLGDQHLTELRTLLANVSGRFRAAFVDDLELVDHACPPHVAVVIAMSRATVRVADQACEAHDSEPHTGGLPA